MGAVVPFLALGLIAILFGIAISQMAMLATTIFLHRHLAHGSIELRPAARATSRIVIWITTALKPRQWAQVHRYHHAVEDTPDDPHTPRNFGGGRRGAWSVFWRNAPLYTQCTHDARLAKKYRDLVADRWDRRFFDHGQAGLALGVSVACLTMAAVGYAIVGGPLGIAVGVAAGLLASALHAGYYLLAGGAINGFGHAGTVHRRIGGYTQNMPVVAMLTVGEGWHRNHHTAENSPRFGRRRQVDLGWVAIRGLCQVRLASVTTRGEAGLRRLEGSDSPPRGVIAEHR
jgi:stearoyl-CoA desaturase (delta-9 desaturase)